MSGLRSRRKGARREGHEEMTSSEFHEVMVERRFAEARTKKQRFWKGIALQQDGDW